MAIFTDTLTGTDGTLWQNHTPETGTVTRLAGETGVDCTITSNQLTPESAGNSGVIYTLNGTYPAADYELTATRVAAPSSASRPTYLLLRVQDVDNLYAVRFGLAGSNNAQIYKRVAGTWSALGTDFPGPDAGSVVKFQVIGTTLKVFDDGVEVRSVSDTAISATGTAGFAAGGGAELVTSTDDSHASNIWDTFAVDNLGAGGGSTELAGTSAGAGSATASLTVGGGTVSLSGTSAGAGTAIAALASTGGTVALAGESAGIGEAIATLSSAGGTVALSGSSTGEGVASASLTSSGGTVPLAGTSAGTATASATLTSTGAGDVELAGSSAGSTTIPATLTATGGDVVLTAAAAGTGNASGTLDVSGGTVALAGSINGTSAATAFLTSAAPGEVALVGSTDGTSTATATLTVTGGNITLTATLGGSSTASAILSTAAFLVAAAGGVGNATVTLSVAGGTIDLTGILSGSSTPSAVLFVEGAVEYLTTGSVFGATRSGSVLSNGAASVVTGSKRNSTVGGF